MIGFGSSVATTPAALREMLKAAYAEEEAAGDNATSASIGCLLTWMNFHRDVPLEETTDLGPKSFTYWPVPFEARSDDTAQVYSVAVKGIKPELGFQWPLDVYGFVAVRDNLDCKRNIIFRSDRSNCQRLTAEWISPPPLDVRLASAIDAPAHRRCRLAERRWPRLLLFLIGGRTLAPSHAGGHGLVLHPRRRPRARSRASSPTPHWPLSPPSSQPVCIVLRVRPFLPSARRPPLRRRPASPSSAATPAARSPSSSRKPAHQIFAAMEDEDCTLLHIQLQKDLIEHNWM